MAFEPVQVPELPKSGFMTTEFIGTMLTHALAALAIILDLLHVNWSQGLSSVEALIPVIAVSISALLQTAYSNHRTQLKTAHVQQVARVRVTQIEQAAGAVEAAMAPGLIVPAPEYSPIKPLEEVIPTSNDIPGLSDVKLIVPPDGYQVPLLQNEPVDEPTHDTTGDPLPPPIVAPDPISSTCPRCGHTEVTDDRQ
jgi:hypothetical protein